MADENAEFENLKAELIRLEVNYIYKQILKIKIKKIGKTR